MACVSYYLGRPASFWLAISGRVPATAQDPTSRASTAAAPGARRSAPDVVRAPAAPTASATPAWEAWAGAWFNPHRQP